MRFKCNSFHTSYQLDSYKNSCDCLYITESEEELFGSHLEDREQLVVGNQQNIGSVKRNRPGKTHCEQGCS